MPEVSPAGMCDCITVIYEGVRRVLTLGQAGALAAFTVTDLSGTDVNGDRFPDLVVSAWSGGAHCCYSNGVYSVGEDVKPVLVLETGNCGPGEFEDLDGDGTKEFIICDDQWAYTLLLVCRFPVPTSCLFLRSGKRHVCARHAAIRQPLSRRAFICAR